MSTATVSLNKKSLAKRVTDASILKEWSPPCVMLEGESTYSVILNLLGIDLKNILIDVNEKRHELAIYVGKKNETSKSAAFWVFGVPRSGMLNKIKACFQTGALEVTIPKRFLVAAA